MSGTSIISARATASPSSAHAATSLRRTAKRRDKSQFPGRSDVMAGCLAAAASRVHRILPGIKARTGCQRGWRIAARVAFFSCGIGNYGMD